MTGIVVDYHNFILYRVDFWLSGKFYYETVNTQDFDGMQTIF